MTSLIWRQQSWSKYQIRDSFFYQILHAIPTINKINQSIASWRTKIRSQICAQKEGWWYWHLSYFALYWRIGFCKTEKLISKVNTSFLIPERFVIMSACTLGVPTFKIFCQNVLADTYFVWFFQRRVMHIYVQAWPALPAQLCWPGRLGQAWASRGFV